jgi:hypothetical protein
MRNDSGPVEIRVEGKTIETVWNCTEAARFLRLHPKTSNAWLD